jgi:copper chaperone NosL
MAGRTLALALAGSLLIGGCDEAKQSGAPPPPHTLTAAAVGTYCGMTLVEHAGPKGQILLARSAEPLWFSSARDAIAFTLLPEEAKDVRAIYVSDMGRAARWEDPGADNWTDATRAVYVIGSARRGGMGAEETIPFADPAAARRFAAEHGGEVVAFADIPRSYVLGSTEPGQGERGDSPPTHDATPPAAPPAAPKHQH